MLRRTGETIGLSPYFRTRKAVFLRIVAFEILRGGTKMDNHCFMNEAIRDRVLASIYKGSR